MKMKKNYFLHDFPTSLSTLTGSSYRICNSSIHNVKTENGAICFPTAPFIVNDSYILKHS